MSNAQTFATLEAGSDATEGYVRTRWWWVRHAPVRVDGGRIYGQQDLPCDCSDASVFRALGRMLPKHAVWIATTLMRTRQTAEAIWAASGQDPQPLQSEADLVEQNLGEWQGLDRASFLATRRMSASAYWFAASAEAPPGGESFDAVYDRVAAAVTTINSAHRGRDLVVVAHGGVIRAAIALALGLPAQAGLTFAIDNCAVTRLDHLQSATETGWRVAMVNQRPIPDGNAQQTGNG